jgi:mitogen-activated protein kinase kinase kinase 19
VAIKKLRMDARRSSAYDAEDEESDRGSSASIKDEVLNNVLDEIRLLSMLSHDNIVGYLGSCVIDMTMMIVMEYVAGGSMAYILEKFGKISPSSTAHYCRHILRGLQYLHSHDVVHLDVKPGNVLVGDHGRCKLVDFGTASMYNTSTKASTVRGTPLYMAPEAIRGQATKTSDIWSFGMTVLELLTGKEGWPVTPDMNPFFLMELIAHPSNAPIVPDPVPQPARRFVLRSTDRNPGSRPTAQQLLDDAFLL